MAGLFFGALMFASESNLFFSYFFLRATTNSAIRKLKESSAVEMCGVGVEEYGNLSEMFHFSFSRMNSGIFVAYLFFFPPTERLLDELKSALGLCQYRRNSLEMHVACVYFRMIPNILIPAELHEIMWNCFVVEGG